MIEMLKRPFPAMTDSSQRWRSALLIGLFVFAFLYVFRPFGLENVQGGLFIVTLIYGLITAACLLVNQFLLPALFPGFYEESQWNVGKEMLQSMANIMLIAICNFLFSAYLKFFPWSTQTFLLFIGFTLAVGIFPVAAQVLIRRNIYHRRHIEAVLADNRILEEKGMPTLANQEVIIKSEDEKIAFRGPSSEVLALASAGNYVEIHLREGKPILARNALSSIEEELPSSYFRTHRSWIVNLEAIQKVDGNARGYVVKFETERPEVPVSRSKLKSFDEALRTSATPAMA
jgi:hypothetical protein